MTTASAPVHDRLATLADPTRGRLLLLLDQNELTVGELCAVLGLPQSTVSRHLRVLADEGWVENRQEGTSRYYARRSDLDPAAGRLWALVSEDLRTSRSGAADRARLSGVLAQRREKSREFFSSAGARWDDLRRELFGGTGGSALLGLLGERLVVGDLGCGAGHVTSVLAPWVGRIVAVDASGAMLEEARRRLAGASNVEFRVGELESIPLSDGEIDAAILSLVLHYASDPARVLQEAHRVVRPGGRLLLVDLLPHGRVEFRQQMGHVWLGFSEEQVRRWLEDAGFTGIRVRVLPTDPEAKGPGLFVATAEKGK